MQQQACAHAINPSLLYVMPCSVALSEVHRRACLSLVQVFAQPSADVVALEQIPSSSLMTYGTAVDIWAIGTLVYEALTGMVPFYHPEPALMALKMQHGRPHPLPLGTSHACQAFLNAALQKEASKRPTAAELLEHPWIQQHADAAAAMVATRVKNKVLAELELDRCAGSCKVAACLHGTYWSSLYMPLHLAALPE